MSREKEDRTGDSIENQIAIMKRYVDARDNPTEPVKVRKREFLINSFWRSELQRYVVESIEFDDYDCLRISRRPDQFEGENRKVQGSAFLCSPIGSNSFKKICWNMGIQVPPWIVDDLDENDLEGLPVKIWFSKKDFIAIVKEEKDFEWLVNWTYRYQASEERVGKDTVRSKYEELLGEIYSFNFRFENEADN